MRRVRRGFEPCDGQVFFKELKGHCRVDGAMEGHVKGSWDRDAGGWHPQARTHPVFAWKSCWDQMSRKNALPAPWEHPEEPLDALEAGEGLEAQTLPGEPEWLVERTR